MVRQHLGLMTDLSAWLGERGLGAGQLSPAVAGGFTAIMRLTIALVARGRAVGRDAEAAAWHPA